MIRYVGLFGCITQNPVTLDLIQNWPAALNRFSIEFSERMPDQYK